ncbi:FAD-dependent oxidoreductase [Georgenia sp. MJ206]|uniref:protoporphyrinogen/coproporphyrinogen oxidase n=1 Tax=Georgenia wangjunii TaxID=3117730 RepID=UPI002F2632CC
MTHADAVVVGAGMAGLTAAHALVRRGLRPVVLEAASAPGGSVVGGTVGAYEVDLGAESFAVRGGRVAALARELGLPVEEPAGAGSSVWAPGPDGHERALLIPPASTLGIPWDLDAPEVAAALSPGGLARARSDAGLGPEAGADAGDLATLVRTRMGEAVLEQLVRPIAGGIHSTDPENLHVDAVAPGLRAALRVHGSLAAAVRALRADAPAGAVVATTTGGLFRLPRALAAAVSAGGEVRTSTHAVDVRARPGGAWEVRGVGPGGEERWVAPRVVVATPGPQAVRLLAGVVDTSDVVLPRGRDVTHVTLVVRSGALDAAPRGAGLLVSPRARDVRAKALTHATAKWRWLGEATAPAVHVVRLSYGGPGRSTAGVGPDLAARELALLLGVEPPEVLAARVVRWREALAPSAGALPPVARLRADLAGLPGLAVTGAWVAGTGLAAVVADADEVGAGV